MNTVTHTCGSASERALVTKMGAAGRVGTLHIVHSRAPRGLQNSHRFFRFCDPTQALPARTLTRGAKSRETRALLGLASHPPHVEVVR